MKRPKTVTSKAMSVVSAFSGMAFLQENATPGLAFCLSHIRRHINVPRSDRYWMQISQQQWPDESGVPCSVGLYAHKLFSAYREHDSASSYTLRDVDKYLRRLGVPADGAWHRIYWRLLYEVNA